MVKLTAELIEQSAQYTNPVRDRELDLRGCRYVLLPLTLLGVWLVLQIRVLRLRLLLTLFCGKRGPSPTI